MMKLLLGAAILTKMFDKIHRFFIKKDAGVSRLKTIRHAARGAMWGWAPPLITLSSSSDFIKLEWCVFMKLTDKINFITVLQKNHQKYRNISANLHLKRRFFPNIFLVRLYINPKIDLNLRKMKMQIKKTNNILFAAIHSGFI